MSSEDKQIGELYSQKLQRDFDAMKQEGIERLDEWHKRI